MGKALTWAFKFWQKRWGYSDDSEHVHIGLSEMKYRRTKNPKYVWKAIVTMDQLEMTNYPKWIRDYLIISAKKLDVCSPIPGGKDGVVAAFGFSSMRQLRKEDYSSKASVAFDEMCYFVSRGKTIEEAVLEVEFWINNDDLKPNQRGYLGNSKLEKIYRELLKTANPTQIANHIEARENMDREYEEAVEKGYEKDFTTYIEERADEIL